jgi:signal transduction histidine kinase
MATSHPAGLSSTTAGAAAQPLNPILRRWLAGALLLLTACAGGFALWLSSIGCGAYPGVTPLMAFINVVSALAFAVLGAFLFIYQPGNRIGWLCCWIALGLASTVLAILGLPCAAAATPPHPGLAVLTWAKYSFGAFPLILPLFILLPLLFPTGHFLSSRWAGAAATGVALLFIAGLGIGVVPDFRQESGFGFRAELDNPFGLGRLPAWWYGAWRAVMLLAACALCLMGIGSMVVRLRRSTGEERQQMKWLAYFLSTAVAIQILGFELPGGFLYPAIFHTIWYDLMMLVVLLGFPLTIGIAIFKYRLYDIDIIINRTLVYGALTLIVAAVYVLMVAASSRLLHNENDLFASLAATGVIAVLFHPLRSWLQRAVDRRLYGERDDPAGVLTRLTSQLEAANSGSELLDGLVETIASSLKLPYVALWLFTDSGDLALAAAAGMQTTHVEHLPLMHQQEAIGRLDVALRSPGEALSAADRRLLTAVARLTATTARTIQLTGQVQEARVRTVSAREEERRRLRRDLHDGLGPVLASQGLKLAAARQLVRTKPEVAEGLLDDVMSQGENTMAEVRRLVYALRPPTLDEFGLVGAIREHVEVAGANAALQITVAAPPELPEIPAAIEVAAFRIVQEALNNVIRHACARHCTIAIAANDMLQVRIEDDGVGLPEHTRSGVGLQSMHERATEVGGVCKVERGEGGGVTVRLSLPLAG